MTSSFVFGIEVYIITFTKRSVFLVVYQVWFKAPSDEHESWVSVDNKTILYDQILQFRFAKLN